VEQGPARAVFSQPAHPYTRELLASTISLSTTALHYIAGAPPDLVAPPAGCRFHPRCAAVMLVCPTEHPPMVAAAGGQRVACWLHGPADRIPAGGTAALSREADGAPDDV
jgi:oligopeptide/dipeptide ABC transporter ATP-binding protein